MRILGIVSRTHDSGLALLERGVPLFILEEERFNREKHTRKFPFSKRHKSRNLCLTGGVALNCVANARILRDTDYRSVWVPPCASDSGAPFGSALWHYHQTLGRPRA